jgi:hypothetical protein
MGEQGTENRGARIRERGQGDGLWAVAGFWKCVTLQFVLLTF